MAKKKKETEKKIKKKKVAKPSKQPKKVTKKKEKEKVTETVVKEEGKEEIEEKEFTQSAEETIEATEEKNKDEGITEVKEEPTKKKVTREAIYFTETHEWIKVIGKEAYIGITDYAVKKLTDLVHIELPEVGDEIVQGESFGSIESVKAVSDLNAPVSGKVLEVNEEVISNLDLISNEPYDEGWLIKISISNPTELDSLMIKKDYENYIKTIEEEEEE